MITVKSVTTASIPRDKPPKGASKGDRIVLRDRLVNVAQAVRQARRSGRRPRRGRPDRSTSPTSGTFDGVTTLPGGTHPAARRHPRRARDASRSSAAPAGTPTRAAPSASAPGASPLNTYRLGFPGKTAGRRRLADRAGGQLEQHPVVAERVRLDALEIEELGDALVERAAQLGVDLGRDRRALDLAEAEARRRSRART